MATYLADTKETELGIHANSRHLYDKIRCGIFNATNGRIKISGIAISSIDTEFTYLLVADGKLTKAQLEYCRTMAQGIAIGCELEGQLHLA